MIFLLIIQVTAPNKCLTLPGEHTMLAMLKQLSVVAPVCAMTCNLLIVMDMHLQRIMKFIAEIPSEKVKDHGVLPLIPTRLGNVAIFSAW